MRLNEWTTEDRVRRVLSPSRFALLGLCNDPPSDGVIPTVPRGKQRYQVSQRARVQKEQVSNVCISCSGPQSLCKE